MTDRLTIGGAELSDPGHRIISHLHSMRVTRLDADGNPTGESVALPVRSLTLTTTEGTTTMTKLLDPSQPGTLTDEEAAALATRPTKALVVELLQELRTERDRTAIMQRAREDALMDLRTSEDSRKEVRAQLDADPEARLIGELQAAVDAYHQRVAEADERAAQARRCMAGGGYAMQVGTIQPTREYQPALDSPLGRALLHLAARHGIAITATTVYPEPQGPSLAVIPPHLAGAVEHLVERDGW